MNNKELDHLEEIIEALDTMYEEGEDCIHPDTEEPVSDPEYDLMREKLRKHRPNSRIFKDVTASKLTSTAKKVKHVPPMTSIHKAIGTLQERQKALADWEATVIKELGYKGNVETWAVCGFKWDGVALALYYEKGKLVQAGLRPRDGVSGEDVTENVKFIEDIPTQLPVPLTISIRGEVVCKKSVFNHLNSIISKKEGRALFANPRNYATGSIRQFKDPSITKERGLYFCAYALISDDPIITKMTDEIVKAKYCAQVLKIPYVQIRPFRYDSLEAMEKLVSTLDYEVDGIVISVRNLEDREQMGTHGDSPNGDPKGRLAWKFAEERAQPVVKSIECHTGRTRRIVPVCIFKPVHLAGTQVQHATGHNVGYMLRNEITVGTTVLVEKAGKIIPKVVGVVAGKGKWDYPKHCPACGHATQLIQNKEAADLLCTNLFCSAAAVNTLCHYLSTFGVKGVAESTVQTLYDNNLVVKPADFYRLLPEQLMKIGLGDRNSVLAVARIHMIGGLDRDTDEILAEIRKAMRVKKPIPLSQLFACFGIEGAGKSAGRALAAHFRSFDKIAAASVPDLESIENIGSTTAENINHFFRENRRMVDDLLQYVEPQLPKAGKLTGQTFCFTGGFPEGKRHWEDAVSEQGGTVVSSVGKKVNFVVVGVDAGSKEQKAKELNIKTLTLDELKKMI